MIWWWWDWCLNGHKARAASVVNSVKLDQKQPLCRTEASMTAGNMVTMWCATSLTVGDNRDVKGESNETSDLALWNRRYSSPTRVKRLVLVWWKKEELEWKSLELFSQGVRKGKKNPLSPHLLVKLRQKPIHVLIELKPYFLLKSLCIKNIPEAAEYVKIAVKYVNNKLLHLFFIHKSFPFKWAWRILSLLKLAREIIYFNQDSLSSVILVEFPLRRIAWLLYQLESVPVITIL